MQNYPTQNKIISKSSEKFFCISKTSNAHQNIKCKLATTFFFFIRIYSAALGTFLFYKNYYADVSKRSL